MPPFACNTPPQAAPVSLVFAAAAASNERNANCSRHTDTETSHEASCGEADNRTIRGGRVLGARLLCPGLHEYGERPKGEDDEDGRGGSGDGFLRAFFDLLSASDRGGQNRPHRGQPQPSACLACLLALAFFRPHGRPLFLPRSLPPFSPPSLAPAPCPVAPRAHGRRGRLRPERGPRLFSPLSSGISLLLLHTRFIIFSIITISDFDPFFGRPPPALLPRRDSPTYHSLSPHAPPHTTRHDTTHTHHGDLGA